MFQFESPQPHPYWELGEFKLGHLQPVEKIFLSILPSSHNNDSRFWDEADLTAFVAIARRMIRAENFSQPPTFHAGGSHFLLPDRVEGRMKEAGAKKGIT